MQFQHLNNIRKLIFKSGILFEILDYVIATRDNMIQSGQVRHEESNCVLTVLKQYMVDDFSHSVHNC